MLNKIFIQNNDGSLVPTNRKELFKEILGDEFDWESGEFSDGSSNWIEIRQRNQNETKEITVGLSFNDDRSKIIEVGVWETPVKTIVVDDDSVKLV